MTDSSMIHSQTSQKPHRSYQQLKFIFSAVLHPLKEANIILHFDEPVRFKFRTGSLTIESIRNLLKIFDLNYPIDGEQKKSYSKMTTKEFHDHIAWIELKASEAGYTFMYIDELWNATVKEHRDE